ncbi:TetR/AcrR family transcriptional regulator [Allokutzneria albata]|uniref:DNA-binding transcriptional regulator, AcrR family n=1 Tax=Allokutzneria albata TaxID=211114 RepID=A0A1G9UUR1_ALLAB|nr:TetR/AcrR family transcriptional regulator [Allokutzneria albata]SDM63652.1 DNA-binding transcriptional regulator, AcrR family [Allokutzneria albata]
MGKPETGVRARTKRAILAAAAMTLARDRAATLADIAAAAEVGRSTVQRYFAEREDLVKAVTEDSLRVLGEATEEAGIGRGEPGEAMRRLVAAMLSVAERVLYLYGDAEILDSIGGVDQDDEGSRAVRALIERGQADGTFDAGADPWWIESVLWSLVYSACDAVSRGRMPRHGAAATVIRTLEQGISGGGRR